MKNLLIKIMGVEFDRNYKCVHSDYCGNFKHYDIRCYQESKDCKRFRLPGHVEEILEIK